MEREIKFRVWDNVDYMSSPFTLQDLQRKKVQFTSDCKVMQFTGLKDKNGVEIYEGDIIGRQLVGDEIEVIGRIIFDVDFAAFCISYENGGWAYLGQHMVEEKNYRKEVLGNIYEHPNLLK